MWYIMYTMYTCSVRTAGGGEDVVDDSRHYERVRAMVATSDESVGRGMGMRRIQNKHMSAGEAKNRGVHRKGYGGAWTVQVANEWTTCWAGRDRNARRDAPLQPYRDGACEGGGGGVLLVCKHLQRWPVGARHVHGGYIRNGETWGRATLYHEAQVVLCESAKSRRMSLWSKSRERRGRREPLRGEGRGG